MKWCFFFALMGLCFVSCDKCSQCDTDVVSQRFIHKYGFELNEDQWEEREQDGTIEWTLRNGTVVVASYENGVLQGPTTYTYPNSTVLARKDIYEQGVLLKEIHFDDNGIPICENDFEFDDQIISTLWDAQGAPMSIEEHKGSKLLEAKYFNSLSEEEAIVTSGKGTRMKRDRNGLLLLTDQIENGRVIARTTFHPNGEVQSEAFYNSKGELDGIQKKFTVSGKPLLKTEWNNGIQDGLKIAYRNGKVVSEIPFSGGRKHGMEKHFDENGAVVAEIQWNYNLKHGSSRYYAEDNTDIQWYYHGEAVSLQQFEMLEEQERLLCELTGEEWHWE